MFFFTSSLSLCLNSVPICCSFLAPYPAGSVVIAPWKNGAGQMIYKGRTTGDWTLLLEVEKGGSQSSSLRPRLYLWLNPVVAYGLKPQFDVTASLVSLGSLLVAGAEANTLVDRFRDA